MAVIAGCNRFFIAGNLIFIALFLFHCEKRKDIIDNALYEGPLLSMDSIFTMMSDSAKVVMKLTAPRQENFENGDREWSEGLYLEYLDDKGNVKSTFRADYVIYTEKDRLYRGEGNVVVKNMKEGDELTTEELFWNPKKEEFYTDRFLTIQSGGEIHTGEGLTADQDFSTYTIHKPSGTMELDEE